MAFGYKRIFAALDGASTQRAVMERAIALAEEEHAELTFGHVIDSVPYEASGVDFELLCNEGKIRIDVYSFKIAICIFSPFKIGNIKMLKILFTSRRLISREGRSAVWRSPECLP